MGNRAVITFDTKPSPQSVGVYLHWNGGPESVLAFAEALNHFKVRGKEDESYQLSRFVQIIGNYIGGTTSIGVGKLSELDLDNGDNGVFIIDRAGDKITLSQSKSGSLSLSKFVELDQEAIKKHSYWIPDKDGGSMPLKVIAKNKTPFSEG
jgi:hypothetical protein